MLLDSSTIGATIRQVGAARISEYLLSLPERVLRSASALAGGLLREAGEVALPASLRRTRLYRLMVEATLRFLIEQVGQVEGAFPAEGKLAEDFVLRRTAGNGIELLGLLTFHVSPVWVMAALADLTGTGRYLIQEIAAALKKEGLLDEGAEFHTVDQLLDGLEKTSGRLAQAINEPPLDVRSLRREWLYLREHALPGLPSTEELTQIWRRLEQEAASQDRSVFELSSVMALSAVRNLPRNLLWLSRTTGLAARETGRLFGENLLDHYRDTLAEIHHCGYLSYCVREFSPYLRGAAQQFSPRRDSLTQRLLRRAARGN